MDAVRLGFIGLGHVAVNSHLPALDDLIQEGSVTLEAFCDRDEGTASEQARAFGARTVYTDHRDMFEREDLDGVFICIPPTLHTDAELIAAEKRIAVLVEKPPTLDMQQAVKFSEAFQEAGVLAQVGFMCRYYATADYVREMVAQRVPRHAVVQLLYSGKHIRYWTSRFELCGGSFVESSIHIVDLLRYWLGDIKAVSAFYCERRAGEGPEPINLPHVYDVTYRFESGVVASIITSRVLTNVSVQRRDISVICDDSLIECSEQQVTNNGSRVCSAPDQNDPFRSQARAFVEAIRSGDRSGLRNDYPQALNSLAAVLGANVSASRGGDVIQLGDLVTGGPSTQGRTSA